jgi:hypothetical protein
MAVFCEILEKSLKTRPEERRHQEHRDEAIRRNTYRKTVA